MQRRIAPSLNFFHKPSPKLGVSKQFSSPNIFTESKVTSFYGNNALPKDLSFELLKTSPEKILSILQGLNSSKAAGIANLSVKFSKDGADVLAR